MIALLHNLWSAHVYVLTRTSTSNFSASGRSFSTVTVFACPSAVSLLTTLFIHYNVESVCLSSRVYMSRSVEEWLNSSRRSNISLSVEYSHGNKTLNITYITLRKIFYSASKRF